MIIIEEFEDDYLIEIKLPTFIDIKIYKKILETLNCHIFFIYVNIMLSS